MEACGGLTRLQMKDALFRKSTLAVMSEASSWVTAMTINTYPAIDALYNLSNGKSTEGSHQVGHDMAILANKIHV